VILTVPRDEAYYPTLGEQVCDFIEQNLVFGPGDMRGRAAVIDDEKRALIFRMYEVYPRGHAQAGRRRFKRVGLSLRKGSAKTELAAWIAACELHPDGPVRCTGWSPSGEPIGGGVTDPYIPLVAYTEEQSEDLAYGALRIILELSALKDDFDIGLERILRRQGDGKAVALASAPDSRDGARTTFQHFDETHRFTSQRLVDAHKTMLANIPKRRLADAWTTSAPEPGTGSVAESTMEYAKSIQVGSSKDARLFYFHREASEAHDLNTDDGLRAAIVEASGFTADWSDIDGIAEQWRNPMADHAYLERVWLNRLVKGGTQAFDVEQWKALASNENPAKPGDLIVLGFDGAMFHDGTGLVATHVESGFQWVPGAWECPPGGEKRTPPWQVPTAAVDALVRQLFSEFQVWRMYADPPYWQSWIATWAGDLDKGRRDQDKRIVEWWTNRRSQMAAALENYETAMMESAISHDGDPRLTRHIGNARRLNLPQRDEQERPLWLIQKDRQDSLNKIDIAMASVLSWEARTDAIAAGATKKRTPKVFFMGGNNATTSNR
jgi:phage terminase large subunit-like protein